MFIKQFQFIFSMLLRDFPIQSLRGKSVGFFAPMNGGKTESEVGELERVDHAGYNAVAYTPKSNTRDGACLVINGRRKFPAVSVPSIATIKLDLERRIEKIMSRKPADRGRDGFIDIDSIRHRKYSELVGIGIDEINLLTLNEQSAAETIEFLKWARQQNFVVYVAGLLYDFRQMSFGQVHTLLPYIDIKQEIKPACKAIRDEKQCGDPAIHSLRLWSYEFVREVGLASLAGDMAPFDFADKRGKVVSDRYVPAPFFDKTLRIAEAGDGRNVYIPVCENCAVLPYKEEVFRVYDAIVAGKDSHGILGEGKTEKTLTKAILHFLSEENWLQQRGKDYIPTLYHRNRLGAFSP